MPYTVTLDDETKEQVATCYLDGHSVATTASLFGISPYVAERVLRGLQVAIRPRGCIPAVPPEDQYGNGLPPGSWVVRRGVLVYVPHSRAS